MAYCDQHHENCTNISQIDKRVAVLENEKQHQEKTNKQFEELKKDFNKFKIEMKTDYTAFKAQLWGLIKGWCAFASLIVFVSRFV